MTSLPVACLPSGRADRRDEVNDPELAKHLKHDWRTAELSEKDKTICEWAIKLTITPGKMGMVDIDSLKDAGFSEPAIRDTDQVVGYFNYINRIGEGLGVDLEPEMK